MCVSVKEKQGRERKGCKWEREDKRKKKSGRKEDKVKEKREPRVRWGKGRRESERERQGPGRERRWKVRWGHRDRDVAAGRHFSTSTARRLSILQIHFSVQFDPSCDCDLVLLIPCVVSLCSPLYTWFHGIALKNKSWAPSTVYPVYSKPVSHPC